jgi:hypothetical protein
MHDSNPDRRRPSESIADAAERFEEDRIRRLGPLASVELTTGKPVTAMPEKPTLADFFLRRFGAVSNHCLQSAQRALSSGAPEEAVFACLIHDTGMILKRPDHGFWAEALYKPYVSDRVAFSIRYHQSLRFFPAPDYGYEYPAVYIELFGADYEPEPYLRAEYDYARNHRWYEAAMEIVVNDDYSFDPGASPSLDPFVDTIGRHFRQPAEGLGWDSSPSSFMWRTLIDPNRPL